MTATETLSEALASFGIEHVKSAIDGYRDCYRKSDGKLIGSYTAHEGWVLVAILRNTEAA